MIILDTNVISEAFKSQPDQRVIAWLNAISGEVAITAITLAELLAGIQRLPDGRRKSNLSSAINRALQPYRDSNAVLTFDPLAAEEYGLIVAAREHIGLPISMADAQIAAICRVHRATCATRNTRDFAHTGVDLVNPWEAP